MVPVAVAGWPLVVLACNVTVAVAWWCLRFTFLQKLMCHKLAFVNTGHWWQPLFLGQKPISVVYVKLLTWTLILRIMALALLLWMTYTFIVMIWLFQFISESLPLTTPSQSKSVGVFQEFICKICLDISHISCCFDCFIDHYETMQKF